MKTLRAYLQERYEDFRRTHSSIEDQAYERCMKDMEDYENQQMINEAAYYELQAYYKGEML